MHRKLIKHRHAALALLLPLALTACGGGSNSNPPPAPVQDAMFRVTVTNLTNAQPLSPIAVIAHSPGFRPFTIGTAATPGLERLAEDGDNSEFITEAQADTTVLATDSGAGVIVPGGSESIDITVGGNQLNGLQISVMTMLVNTNDAFSGANAVDISALAPQETLSVDSIAYDAGTELDDELGAHIPGPAGGGEGFNAARDDEHNHVSMHNGVVTLTDGLLGSALGSWHRFDNPVTRITVTRMQ